MENKKLKEPSMEELMKENENLQSQMQLEALKEDKTFRFHLIKNLQDINDNLSKIGQTLVKIGIANNSNEGIQDEDEEELEDDEDEDEDDEEIEEDEEQRLKKKMASMNKRSKK